MSEPMRIFSVIFFLFLLDSNVFCQTNIFDEQTFFENIQSSYYSLESTKTKNISVLLTNVTTETFAGKVWNNPEIFPLQLIWLSPDRLFISQQGVPSLSDSLKVVYSNLVNNLKSQITDILFDLKRFYFSDIYNSISENYLLNHKEDVVQIKFSSILQTDTTFYEYYFGLNGLCLKIISYTPSKNLKIETIPHFKISKTRWIISGWEVQMYTKDVIQTGYSIDINYKDKKNIWILSEIILSVQRKNTVGKTFNEVLKFRNFLFDQSLHYLEQTK